MTPRNQESRFAKRKKQSLQVTWSELIEPWISNVEEGSSGRGNVSSWNIPRSKMVLATLLLLLSSSPGACGINVSQTPSLGPFVEVAISGTCGCAMFDLVWALGKWSVASWVSSGTIAFNTWGAFSDEKFLLSIQKTYLRVLDETTKLHSWKQTSNTNLWKYVNERLIRLRE